MLFFFFFFFSFGWIKHSTLHTRVFQVHLPFYNNQNPKSFLSFNIQLSSTSINAMEFQKNISVSMMHTFGYFCILYRKRFSIYSDCTFLHNFKGPGLCSAKRILPKVWLLIFFICLCFPSFLWISKLKHPQKNKKLNIKEMYINLKGKKSCSQIEKKIDEKGRKYT